MEQDFVFQNSSNEDAISYSLPVGWEWVRDVVDAAHLPHLALPVQWDTTQEKHAKIAFDPTSKTTVNISTGKKTMDDSNSVGFIMATKGRNPMPGTQTPASVRYTRYMDPCLQEALVKGATGSISVPCIAHGDYVKVESLAADHLEAKEKIITRQKTLVNKLNEDSDFAEFLLQQPGMNKFFVKFDNSYYGTLLFYELYFNDIDNIWLICDACNLQKSNQETLDWLGNQWLYGQEFLDYLAKLQIQEQGILTKSQDKKGLAKVAIEWFWKRHANYVSSAKRLYQNVVVPIQILNIKVDHVAGSGNQARTERLQTSLMTQILLAEGMLQAKIGMPKGQHESPHSSSNDEHRLSPFTDEQGRIMPVDATTYQEVSQEYARELPGELETSFKRKLRERIAQRESSPSGEKRIKMSPGSQNERDSK